MGHLTPRQRALLNEIEARPVLDEPFGRLITLFLPHVEKAIRADWRPAEAGQGRPDANETSVALILTWLEALLQSAYRSGIEALSDLNHHLVPIRCSREQIRTFCRTFGFTQDVFHLLLRLMKAYRRADQRLPDDVLVILTNLGFFIPDDPLRPPADLDEAFLPGDLAFIWSQGVGYVLEVHAGQRCEVAKLLRELIVVESERNERPSPPSYWHGWSRERVGAFHLGAVHAARFTELALNDFRDMIRQFGLKGIRLMRPPANVA